MMQTIKMISKLCMLVCLLAAGTASAQRAGMTIVGLAGQNFTATGGRAYLPGGAYLRANGNAFLAIDSIIAANTATITGAAGSRLHLLSANQLDANVSAKPTLLDVNGASFGVNVSSYNPLNLVLSDQAFGTVASGNGAYATIDADFSFGGAHPFTSAAITDNHVVTNGNKFSVGAAGTLTGFDLNRYVVTNDNAGELRKIGLTVGQSFFFPIGRAETDYTPARLMVASGGSVDYYMNVRNFAESVPDENIGGYAALPNVSRTWLVYGSNSSTVANMDFVHPGTPMYEVNGYDRTNSNVIRFTGGSWAPNLPNDAENESLFGTPVNYFAQQISFAVPNAPGANSFYGKSNTVTVVAVSLTDFSASASGCEGIISWRTASEQDVAYFNVERSYTGRAGSWEPVARVNASGGTVSAQYRVTDTKSIAANAYYRLAIVENDGSVKYSSVRSVSFSCKPAIVGYPNPVTDNFNILLPQGTEKYTIRIFNSLGQSVLPRQVGAPGITQINTRQLSKGSYIAVITDAEGKNTSLQFLKK